MVLALMVVVSHTSTVNIGLLAVGVFFVLSGYWISIMWRERYSRFSHPYPVFIASRYLRLLPCLLAVIPFAIAAVLSFGTGDALGQVGPIRMSAATALTHLTVIGLGFGHLIVRPAWSLDIEMQFYFFAPLLILLVQRIRTAVIAVSICTAVAVWDFLNLYFKWVPNTFLPHFLLFFIIGILIEQFRFRPGRFMVGVSSAVLVILVFVCAFIPFFRPLLIRMPGLDSDAIGQWVAPALCIVAVPLIASILAVRSSRLDRHLGNIAYPLYLVHVIPLGIAHTFMKTGSQIRESPLTLAGVAGSIVLALIIYRVVDIPCERWRHNWLKKRPTT